MKAAGKTTSNICPRCWAAPSRPLTSNTRGDLAFRALLLSLMTIKPKPRCRARGFVEESGLSSMAGEGVACRGSDPGLDPITLSEDCASNTFHHCLLTTYEVVRQKRLVRRIVSSSNLNVWSGLFGQQPFAHSDDFALTNAPTYIDLPIKTAMPLSAPLPHSSREQSFGQACSRQRPNCPEA